LIAFSGPAHSFTIFEQVGLASAPLPVGSGARAQGMGGTFIAVADDATAASWNPAGLIQVEKPEVSLVGAYVDRKEEFSSDTSPEINNTGDVSYSDVNYASATLPFHWHKNLVVSLNYQRLFDFKREFQYQRNLTAPGVDLNQRISYDQDGYVSAIGIAGAIEITPTLSLGATVNIWTDQMGYDNGWTENYSEVAEGSQSGVPVTINTSIQDRYEQFRGINFNLGLLWDSGKWGTFGAVVKTPFTATIQHRFNFNQTTTYGDPVNSENVTGPITVEEQVDLDMPISYGLGWSRRFQDILTLGIDIYRTEWGDYSLTNDQGEEFSPIDGRPKGQSNVDATTHVRIGAEYLFLMPERHMAVPVRAGLFYDPEPSEGSPNDVFGFALGTGLTFERCSLDVAYQLRWAKDADSGNLIAGSQVDITQQTLMASVIIYF
jgi:long-subunit fatty acid transport protein